MKTRRQDAVRRLLWLANLIHHREVKRTGQRGLQQPQIQLGRKFRIMRYFKPRTCVGVDADASPLD